MPRTPYHHLMQDDTDDDDDAENVNEKFSLLLNKNNEDKKTGVSSMNQMSNLSAEAGFIGIELRSRNLRTPFDKNSPSRSSEHSWTSNNGADTVFVERKIRKNDSLRNLALQYGISVAELKRANGLMSDQEFYGKDILKIPVKKYGYHHDLLLSNEENVEQNKLLNLNSNNEILNLDGELVDLNFDYANELPSTSTAVPSMSLLTNVAVTAAPIDRERMEPELFLKTVDDNLLKVKTAQQELERQNRRKETDAEPIEDTGVAIAAPVRSTWMQKNVSHFVVVVLIIFVVIVIPSIIVLYKIVAAVEGPTTN